MSKGTVNKVILIGRLGADPEIRYNPNGVAIAKFNLATNEYAGVGAEGNREERTEWHRIVTFNKTAEFCGNYLSKGRLVFIEGSIQTRQWDDPQGQKRYMTEIIAREVQLLGSGESQGSGQGQGMAQGQGGSQSQSHNQWQGQGQGQSQQGAPGGQNQARSASGAGRAPMEELPAATGAPDDDIPF